MRSSASSCASTRTDEIGAHLFGTVGEVTQGAARGRSATAAWSSATGSASRGSSRSTTASCAGERRDPGAGRRARQPEPASCATREPQQGRQLRLSVDLDVQEAGQEALAGHRPRRVRGHGRAERRRWSRSARCRRSTRTSSPRPSRQSRLQAALRPRRTARRSTNRAIQGGYPTGSTFKLITATAALESGLITPDTALYDGGSLTVGGVVFNNAGGAAHGALALRTALTVSSDVFFYQLGPGHGRPGRRAALQRWARRLGLGRLHGHRPPGASMARARVADPAAGATSSSRSSLTDRPWSVGDNVNLSVGQGDLAAAPLQMAVAYAAIANGGRVLRPRLGQRIEDAAGRALQQLEAPTARRLKIDPAYRPGDPRRACAAPRARRAARRPACSRASRSRSPARPAPRRRGSAAPTSPGTWRWRPTRTRSTWWP